eukprot:UN14569
MVDPYTNNTGPQYGSTISVTNAKTAAERKKQKKLEKQRRRKKGKTNMHISAAEFRQQQLEKLYKPRTPKSNAITITVPTTSSQDGPTSSGGSNGMSRAMPEGTTRDMFNRKDGP